MKRWHKKLPQVFDPNELTRFIRSPKTSDIVEGYVVGASPRFLLIHVLNSDCMILNGYSILRTKDIRRYRIRQQPECFLDQAMKLKGISAVPRPQIDLSSMRAVVTSVNDNFPLVNLFCDFKYPESCSIGRIDDFVGKSVMVDEISAAGKWGSGVLYDLKDITRVDFASGYEDALALLPGREEAPSAPGS